jgi:hypothetical protein
MASAWGKSFGAVFGRAFGLVGTVVQPPIAPPPRNPLVWLNMHTPAKPIQAIRTRAQRESDFLILMR